MNARTILQNKYDRLKEGVIGHEDFNYLVGTHSPDPLTALEFLCGVMEENSLDCDIRVHLDLQDFYSKAYQFRKVKRLLEEIERDNLSDDEILIRKLEM